MLGGCKFFPAVYLLFIIDPSIFFVRFVDQCSNVIPQKFSIYYVQLMYKWPSYRAQYGAPGDFDEWAEIIGDQSWAYKDFSRSVNNLGY